MNIQSIQFHDQEIQVLQHEGKPYVAMKPICENIGLDWRAQRQRILRHEVLKKGVVMMTTPSKGGDQEMITLPLGMLNGWLFGIEINRVKPEIRETLRLYQLECYDVLYNHFLPEVAAVYPNTIDAEQQHEIKSLVNEVNRKTGLHYQTIYTKLYEEFKIPRYQELTVQDYPKAVNFLSSLSSPEEQREKLRAKKVFIAAILKAGITKNHEVSRAYRELENRLMTLVDVIEKTRSEAYEIGKMLRHISVSDGIIHDAMAEPLINLNFDKSIHKEAEEKALKLAKPLNLNDYT